MSLLIKLCDDYLNDRLSDVERKAFEERLAKGDKELAETFYQLKAFSKGKHFRATEEVLHPDETNEDPFGSTLLSMVNETVLSEGKKEFPPKRTGKHEGLAEVLTALEEKKTSKIRTYSIWVLSLLLLMSGGALLYYQWEYYLIVQQLNVLQKKFDSVLSQRNEERELNRNIAFNLERIRALTKGDFFELSKLPLKGNRGEWIQFWDRGTLRIAVWINKPSVPSPNKLQLESLNGKTYEWQQVGVIDTFKEDSLYTIWDTQQLARSIGLRINELSTNENGNVTTEKLAEIRLK